MTQIKSVCVFCGAQNNVPKTHLDLGTDFGKALVKNGMQVVYGGGDCGLMGAVANGALAEGGYVVGVFPEGLQRIEVEHRGLSEIHLVGSMHERKMLMYDKSDAFVVLPGGFGTLDEMFEVITWRQIQVHTKPVIIVNHEGYWDPLIHLMGAIIESGFARKETSSFYTVVNTLDEAIELLKTR